MFDIMKKFIYNRLTDLLFILPSGFTRDLVEKIRYNDTFDEIIFNDLEI